MFHRPPWFLLLIAAILAACSTASRPTQTPPPRQPSPSIEQSAGRAPATPTRPPTVTPLVVRVEGATNLDRFRPSAPFTLRFNQPMDPASATPALVVSPAVTGEERWSTDRTRLTFTPTEGFRSGTSHRLILNAGLRSAAGQTFATPPEWTIRVPAAPAVVERRLDNRPDRRRPTFRLTFDRPMDPDSTAAALSVEPAVPVNLRWNGQTLTIEPRQPLAPGTHYRFTLAQTATDRDGVPLGSDYRWSYWLDRLISGVTPPTRRGDRSTPVVIRFNYAMDPASVAQALTITPPIEGDLGWNAMQTMATLTPTVPLPSDTVYTIRFGDGLREAGGSRFPPPEPVEFTTPPPILSVTPSAGEGVHPASTIRVTFDRPMDPATTAAAVAISPTVPGEFEWHETTLSFRPEGGALDEFTSYSVTIGMAARDADGAPVLRTPYTWSFRTGEFTDLAHFGWGPNAQVVDADGRRAVQFQLLQAQPTILRFDLYRLSLEQFLDRYASGFRGVAGHEQRPISTAGTTLVKSWEIETTGRPRSRANAQELTLPGDVPPGLYILNLTAGHLNDQLILLLTRHTIVLKQAEGQIVAWVTDINGGSVASVEVSVYARDGTLLAQGRTDGNGVYRTAVSRDPQPLIVVARDGDDITASGLSNEWRSQGDQWWGWWRPAPQALDFAAHIYTDRPIYRPGQTVFFKGIVRHDDDAIISLPLEGTPVTARIRDARDNVVQTFELATNGFGSVNGEFQLAEGAMLGDYAVEMVLDGESHRQTFKVQDYRKPDYQVSVTASPARAVAGDLVTVSVDTRYFFGKPVPNAGLVVKQYELLKRWWWDQDDEPDYIWAESFQPEIKGITDANGHYTFTLTAGLSKSGPEVFWQSSLKQSTWGIEVTVDDGSHQTVSNFAVVEVFDAAEKVHLDHGDYLKTPGAPFTVRAAVATLSDEPVSGRELRLELRRYNPGTGNYTTVVQSAALTTGDDGQASLPFTINPPGYYQLALAGTDRLGHPIGYTSWIYAFSSRDRWARSDDRVLTIAADRESYAPGESARLLIESTFSGPALLTFERGTTRREQLVELTAPVTLVEVPIQPDDAPNIFVTVNAWKEEATILTPETYASLPDSRLHTASVELRVPVTGRRLSVTITPDKERYAPREEASFTVRVTNERGEPVSAELSLALVDEAIFSLSDDLSGPIFDAFYRQRDNIVRTYDALALVRYLGGWGGGGGDGFTAANPRSNFPDTAAWVPVVHTDWKGEAVVTLALPDNLTSWRVTAKATTADTQVGETFINVVTQQPIVVRPILPRSLTAGDQVELSALVHNYSDRPRELQVSLSSDALELTGDARQTIRLAPGEVRLVGWAARAREAGEAEVTVEALSLPFVGGGPGRGSGDAVRLTLPVRPLAIPEVNNQIGEFSGELTTSILLPEEALDLSGVRIELSRSIAGSLLTGLEYLTGYPYGCVEQTMSRALPNAVVGRAFHQLGIGNPTLQADLPPKINAGLQRLYGYQHNDGGWGWWYDDSSHDYQTAWVVFGLAVTAEAGYEVDPEVITRGAEWLTTHLDSMDVRTRAYALYSLAVAGHGNLEATRALAGRVKELDTFSQAALALALHELGATDEARAIVDALAQTAVVADGKVSWPNPAEDGHYYQKTMASTTRSTALALSAFVRISPNHPLAPGIVRWLMSQRRQDGWGSTNETSFAILALTDHLLARESESADTDYRVELNGTVIAGGRLGRGEPAVSLEIPAGQMVRGANHLRLQQSGGGRLYYLISSRIYLPETRIGVAGSVRVDRTYLDPRTDRPITTVEPGQLVKVRLTVDLPDKGFYIIVEDRLPGGLEALNEGLNTTSHEGSADQEPRYYWQEYGYNNKEVRGDRVSFFITEMDRGRRTFSYFARATHAGTFVAMPAEVSAMYDLTVWGRSASSVFTVAR